MSRVTRNNKPETDGGCDQRLTGKGEEEIPICKGGGFWVNSQFAKSRPLKKSLPHTNTQ